MLLALLVTACRLPSTHGPGNDSESDADTDADSDSDSDVDTDSDADTDWGGYTGPPRLVITASDIWKGTSEWAFYDFETLLWRISGEAVDAYDVLPTCSAAWVGLIRRGGQDGDGVDVKDADSGFTLDDIVLPVGALPRSAVGLPHGMIAVGLDTGTDVALYLPGADPFASVDLAKYADAADAVHVAALGWWEDALVVVLDAGVLTNAAALVIDVESGAVVDARELSTANISDEIAIVDDWLYLFGRGDPLHPDALEAWHLSNGVTALVDATGLGQAALTAASFASEGTWIVADDGKGVSSVRWMDFDPASGFDVGGAAVPSLVRETPLGDVAAEGSRGFWLTEGDDGHTVTRYDAAGDALASWTFSALAAIRTCGADSL